MIPEENAATYFRGRTGDAVHVISPAVPLALFGFNIKSDMRFELYQPSLLYPSQVPYLAMLFLSERLVAVRPGSLDT